MDSIMLHVRGGGDAVTPIVAMCRNCGWQALDFSTGKLIDLDHPSSESWQRFQAYRDKIVRQNRRDDDGSPACAGR